MQKAINTFDESYGKIRELAALYDYLTNNHRLPSDLSDLLRAEWIYSISAFDKLIHDIVRIGMVQAYTGKRAQTDKFKSFAISIQTHNNIQASRFPPAEYWFELEIIQKHSYQSFLEPDKISDALSLVWPENHKWQRIASHLNMPEQTARNTLKNIVLRRHQIVHEADMDIVNGAQRALTKTDTDYAIKFVFKLGTSIFHLVQ